MVSWLVCRQKLLLSQLDKLLMTLINEWMNFFCQERAIVKSLDWFMFNQFKRTKIKQKETW